MKALEGAFNQEKAVVGAFSVIVITDGSFAALFLHRLHLLSMIKACGYDGNEDKANIYIILSHLRVLRGL